MSALAGSVDLLSLGEFQSSEGDDPNVAVPPPQSNEDEKIRQQDPKFDPKALIEDDSETTQARTLVDMSGANTNFFASIAVRDRSEYDVKFPAGKVSWCWCCCC